MSDAAITVPAGGYKVPATPTKADIKSYVRIGIAAAGGSLALHHILPAWAVNDAVIDYVTGAVMLGISVLWARAHNKIVHSKWWSLVTDPRVPNDVVGAA